MSQATATLPAEHTSAIRITAYEEIRARVDALAKDNALKVFKYDDPKENVLARSYVHGLRKMKGDVERARVAAKADAMAYGRRVDSIAKDLEALVDDMIAVHQAPIDAIEAKETDRKNQHRWAIQKVIDTRNRTSSHNSDYVAEGLALVKSIDTSVMEEFKPQADSEILASIRHLETALAGAVKREQEAAELERLRAEKATRDQADRETRIREEAAIAERNKIDEAVRRKAAADAAAAARKESDAKAEQERIEREAREQVAAAERRELETKLASEREVKRIKDEAATKEAARIREQEEIAATERRAAENKRRRVAVHAAIADAIVGLSPQQVVEKIAAGSVPHLAITYA